MLDVQERNMAKGRGEDRKAETPLLEWIAAAVGLLLTLGVLGSLGWEAMQGSGKAPPVIETTIDRVTPTPAGYVVELTLRNRSPATAATVEVEGELTKDDGTIITSTTTLDYVPGESTRKAGLFFKDDPRLHRLEIRPLGFIEP
jgi:uncharacterized protein (TIGR02588 family)